jgi:hypothetical protein
MKVTSKKEEGFKPIKLEITIESKDEQNAFYSLFSHITITDWIEKYGVDHYSIRDCLREGCNYLEIFSELKEEIKNDH